MNSRSEEFLDAPDRTEWFSSVGLRDLQPSTILNSWEEAIAFATSRRDRESFRLEQRNEPSGHLLID
jgi:hypothetical protein